MKEKELLSVNTKFFYFTATVLVFFYIYMCNLSMFGLPAQLHSLRLSAILIVLWGVLKAGKKHRMSSIDKGSTAYCSWLSYVKVVIALFIYSILLLILVGKGEGSTFFDSMINMVLFTLPVVWAFTRIFDNITQFMRVLLLVGIVQSIVIIICLIDDSFALLLDLTFNLSDTDYTADHRVGYAGGIGCITAPGVIRYSTGLIASVFLYLNERKFIYLLVFVLFAVLSSMIARTGILIDVICFITILWEQNNLRKFTVFLLPFAVLVSFFTCIVSSGEFDSLISERYARVMMLQDKGVKEDFFDNYFEGDETNFPPLNGDMLIGTGIVSGKSSNGYVVNVDGGPLRIYSAAGIIVCILVYIFLYKQLYSIAKHLQTRKYRVVMWMYFILFIVSDFKEITFFIVYPMCIYYTAAILMYDDEKIAIV